MFEPDRVAVPFTRHEFHVAAPQGGRATHRDVQDASLVALKAVRDALGQEAAAADDALGVYAVEGKVVFWFDVDDTPAEPTLPAGKTP